VWREVFEGNVTSCPSSSVLSRNRNQHLHACVFLAGQGNFGKVLKARAVGILPDRPDLNVVAVKVVKGDQPQSSAVDELWAELQLMKSLKPHPNIVNLLGQCTFPGMLYAYVAYMSPHWYAGMCMSSLWYVHMCKSPCYAKCILSVSTLWHAHVYDPSLACTCV